MPRRECNSESVFKVSFTEPASVPKIIHHGKRPRSESASSSGGHSTLSSLSGSSRSPRPQKYRVYRRDDRRDDDRRMQGFTRGGSRGGLRVLWHPRPQLQKLLRTSWSFTLHRSSLIYFFSVTLYIKKSFYTCMIQKIVHFFLLVLRGARLLICAFP
jgi:hypothetical protein